MAPGMKASKKRFLLTTLRNALILLAVITMMPRPASGPDLLGYHTVCAFVPVSTFLLLELAGITQMFCNSLGDEAAVRSSESTKRREARG